MHEGKSEDAGIEQQAAALGLGFGKAGGDEQLAGAFETVEVDRFDDAGGLRVVACQSRTASSIDIPLRLRLAP